MGILFLIMIAILCFILLLIGRKFWGEAACFVLGIGSIVGSNVYHIGGFPMPQGNFIFGIDSVLYTLFLFCVLILVFDNKEKSAYNLMYSGIAAVVFNAVLQFFASWGSVGIQDALLDGLLSNLLSAGATFIAVDLVLKLPKKLLQKNCNDYLIIFVCIFLSSLINSLIYFGGMGIFNGGYDSNFGWVLLSSYIGKMLSIVLGTITWYFAKLIDKKSIKNTKNQDSINSLDTVTISPDNNDLTIKKADKENKKQSLKKISSNRTQNNSQNKAPTKIADKNTHIDTTKTKKTTTTKTTKINQKTSQNDK